MSSSGARQARSGTSPAPRRAAARDCGTRQGSPGNSPSAEELLAFLVERVQRWWLPDQWTFIEEIPKTSVGKFDKKVMRAAFAHGDYSVQTVALPK